MCGGRHRAFEHDHFASLEVAEGQHAYEEAKFGVGEPGEGFEAAQAFEVGLSRTFGFIQDCTFFRCLDPTPSAASMEIKCYPADMSLVTAGTRHVVIKHDRVC